MYAGRRLRPIFVKRNLQFFLSGGAGTPACGLCTERVEIRCAALYSRHSSRNSRVKLRWARRLSSLRSFAVMPPARTRRARAAPSLLLIPCLERPALPDRPMKPLTRLWKHLPDNPPCSLALNPIHQPRRAHPIHSCLLIPIGL